MKSYLIALCCFFSATLFAQNPGVIVEIDISNPPQEPILATVDFIGSTETETYSVFIDAGLFSTFYFDPQLTWSEGLVHIEDCNGDSLFDSFAISDSADFYYTSFFYCESDSILGCTDPTALNFNSFATVDDGSCIFNPPANDLCAGATTLFPGSTIIDNTYATQNEGIFGECWNFGSGEGEQSSLWFSFTTPSDPAQINIEAVSNGTWTLTDTQFGLFTECGGEMIYCDGNSGEGLLSAFEFSCGELDTNTTYILMVDGWNGDIGTCILNYEITNPCGVEVFGCTDPEASNYNPDATIDDGSCSYDQCTDVFLGFDFFGGAPTDSLFMQWQIFDSQGETVEEGYFYDPAPQYVLCLEDGCYSLMVSNINPNWDGIYSIYVSNGEEYFGEFNGDSEVFITEFGVNSPNCGDPVEGCTDPNALNYNPLATIDDGSCEYFECETNPILLVFNTQNWGYEISWNIRNEAGEEVVGSGDYPNYSTITEVACLEDGCYTFEMFDSYGDGWNGGTFQIILNDEILTSGTLEGGEYGEIAFGVNEEGCGVVAEVFGCTDPSAINFNPDATIDDGSCQYSCNNIYLGFDFFDGAPNDSSFYFMHWVIQNEFNEVVEAGEFYNWAPQYDLCLDDGCYTFTIFNVSPEWNGIYNLFMANEILAQGEFSGESDIFEFTFGVNEDGCEGINEVYGCTDPFAINYNPSATIDDGTCLYQCTDVSLSFDFTAGSPAGTDYMDWVLLEQSTQMVVDTGSFNDWADFIGLCLGDGCYTFVIGNIPSEWEGIYNILVGNEFATFGEFDGSENSFEIHFGVNGDGCDGVNEIFGCTDPEATNFNPDATIDDGSCFYECEGNAVILHINTSADVDSANYLQYGIGIEYNAYVVTGSATAGQNVAFDICLEDGCYNLYLESWQNQSWVGSEIYAVTEAGDTLFYAAPEVYQQLYVYSFGVNEEGCGDPQEVFGCTDPEALNYNPNATIDDGSCTYDFECGISFDVIADTLGGNLFYIIPSENIVNASSVLWDFGDGSTSAEFYPTYIYETDGPFTLCLFVTFEDASGNYCEISYCEVLEGSIFGGSGILSGGFMINVIQPGSLSDNVSIAEKEISVYPNPTNDIATISFLSDQSDKLTLNVADLTGKIIESRILSTSIGQQNIQVDLSEFPQGLYLIGLEQNGSKSYAKVVRR